MIRLGFIMMFFINVMKYLALSGVYLFAGLSKTDITSLLYIHKQFLYYTICRYCNYMYTNLEDFINIPHFYVI